MALIANMTGSNGIIKWQAEPETRGTFSILSICIITISLCAWSCMHLNLPSVDGSKSFRRLGWFMCALLAPEYLIVVAWTQRMTARKISKEVAEAFRSAKVAQEEDPERQLLQRKHPWTMTHSFWALMGGIGIDSNGSEPFIPSSQRSMLTAQGVSLLLKFEPQLLPDISEDEVKKRSKGSSLSELLACIQVVWFCLSILTRISQKLPISMLEIKAFAHVICTVAVYILWWKKPLNIEQPVLILDDRARRLSAYMWMSSETSCIPKPSSNSSSSEERITRTVGHDPEFEAIIDIKPASEGGAQKSAATASTASLHPSMSTDHTLSTRTLGDDGSSSVMVTTDIDLPGTGFRVNPDSTRWKETVSITTGSHEYTNTETHVHNLPPVFHLNPADVRRWHLAREAIDRYGLEKPDKNLHLVSVRPVKEWMGRNSFAKEKGAFLSTVGFALVMAGYAGLHGLAWNGHFPSHRQQKLWRIATLVLASPAGLVLFLMLLFTPLMLARKFSKLRLRLRSRASIVGPSSSHSPPSIILATEALKSNQLAKEPSVVIRTADGPSPPPPALHITTIIDEKLDDERQQKPPRPRMQIVKRMGVSLWNFVLSVFSLFYILMNFLARVYLIYESLRTVFYLPPGVYQTPRWPQYLPHIT